MVINHLDNDPSAGSPTETLLRLLLPLSAPVRTSFSRNRLPKGQRPPVQGSHWYTQSVVATGGVYKGQGLSHGGLSDPPLLGIPRLWRKIASSRPKHAKSTPLTRSEQTRKAETRAFRGLPAPLGEGTTPAVPGIVARVRPRASKGITDLLLLSVSDGFRAVDPSKKTYSISGGLGVCTDRGLPGMRE